MKVPALLLLASTINAMVAAMTKEDAILKIQQEIDLVKSARVITTATHYFSPSVLR